MPKLLISLFIFLLISACGSSEYQLNSPSQPLIKPLGPYLQDVEPTSAWILWENRRARTQLLKWGLTQALEQKAVSSKWKKPHKRAKSFRRYVHEVKLANLKPGMRYFYQIPGDSKIHTFRTVPLKQKSFSFAVYSDPQRNPTVHRKIIENGIIRMAKTTSGSHVGDHLGFTLVAGDLVHVGADYSEYANKFLNPARKLYSEVPVYPAIGNHAYQELPKGEDPIYTHYFRTPENNGETGVFKRHWYSKRYLNALVVSLNTNLGAIVKYKYHPDMFDGPAAKRQFEWYQKQLQAACKNSDIDFVFTEFHHPHKSEIWASVEEPYSEKINNLTGQIMQSCGKAAVIFTGHAHAYSRGQLRNYPVYLVTAASAGGLLDQWGEYKNIDFDFVQKTFSSFGFVHVTVTGGKKPNFRLIRYKLGTKMSRLGAPKIEDTLYFRRGNKTPSQPVNLSATIKANKILLAASKYKDPEYDAHLETEVEVYHQKTKKLVKSYWFRYENWYKNAANKSTDTVVNKSLSSVRIERLKDHKNLQWRIRYRDASLAWSKWSSLNKF